LDNSLVSIVLPTLNGSRYIESAIQSCLDQTQTEIELIVIDDCSSDSTPEIIDSFLDRRIRIFHNETIKGIANSLNFGFSVSNGQFLTWTSDDNLYAPRAIEKMVSVLDRKPDIGLVYADYWNIDENGTVRDRTVLAEEDKLNETNCVQACFLYRRKLYEVVGDYDPELKLAEDYEYWLRASRDFNFIKINEPLYYYRHHGESLTATEGIIKQQQAAEAARKRWVGPNPYFYPSRFNRTLALKYIEWGFEAHRNDDLATTRHFFIKALLRDPSWIGNGGVLSLLGESVFGSSIMAKVRKLTERFTSR
jgi:glycosyltransferase involved in cell wall biosynthesis